MKTKINLLLSFLFMGSILTASAQKKPTREYVADIPPGRNILIQPMFHDITPVKGKLTIDFSIDKRGNVIMSHANRNSTIKNSAFVHKCEAAVKGAKFSPLQKGDAVQNGSMSYTFK
jgi:hypothetical protein